jgi:hypothetical protein
MKSDEVDIDRDYLGMLEDVSFQPVFILGLHRSGTSILYKMLGATQCFNTVTAYHIIKYDELLRNHIEHIEEKSKEELAQFFKTKGLRDREIDRLKLTPDFGEEYGFILMQKFFQPRLTSKTLPTFINLCKKIQFISRNDKPVLLKNPWDFSNFIYIKKVFERAKIIFIHRNPIKVLDSSVKTIQVLLKTKNPYTALLSKHYEKILDNPLLAYAFRFFFLPNLPFGVLWVANVIIKDTDYFMRNIHALSEKDYICVRYEDLCREPNLTIKNILNFIGVETKRRDYSSFIKPRKTILFKEVERIRMYMFKRMKAYVSYCGYTLESSSV